MVIPSKYVVISSVGQLQAETIGRPALPDFRQHVKTRLARIFHDKIDG